MSGRRADAPEPSPDDPPPTESDLDELLASVELVRAAAALRAVLSASGSVRLPSLADFLE